MTAWEGLVLGLVQGLTEFLPISSSGHLVMGQTLFGLEEANNLPFDVLVHGASLLAILVYFRQRLILLVRHRRVTYGAKIVLGTVPVVIVGFTLREAIEVAFHSPSLVAVNLAVTGILLLSLYLRGDPAEQPRTLAELQPGALAEPTWLGALLIGCAQTVAILPGISRSGSTIVSALWLGLAPAAAAEFSFLLGIPALAGAMVLQAAAVQDAAAGYAGTAFAVGGVASFVSSLAAIMLVFRLLARRGFRRFGFYCLAVAAAFGTYLAVRGPA